MKKMSALKDLIVRKSMETHADNPLLSAKVKRELALLSPGKREEELQKKYLIAKLKKLMLVVGAGCILVLLLAAAEKTKTVLTKDNSILRNDVGEVGREVILDALMDEVTYPELSLDIRAREYTDAEAVAKMNEVIEELPTYILGDNTSLKHVDKPLKLPASCGNNAIQIIWTTDKPDILQSDGELGESLSKDGDVVTLTATLQYKAVEKTHPYAVKVYAPDLPLEKEIEQQLLTGLTEAEQDGRTEEYLKLPTYLGDRRIIWSEHKRTKLPAFLLVIFISGVAVCVGMDRDIHKQYEDRSRELLLQYAKFISQLQLLISCGMSVRSALIRLGRDYQKRRDRTGVKIYLYEELLLVIRRMESGCGEVEAMEEFAKRSGLMCYKKMVSVLAQNIKRGSEGLKRYLKEEVRNAFEERKQLAKRLGEEAETKLLLPMMLMMGIVLIIILVPAFLSFGGI